MQKVTGRPVFVQEIFLFIISNHDVPAQRGVRSKGWSSLRGGKTCPNHLSINLYPKSSILKNFSTAPFQHSSKGKSSDDVLVDYRTFQNISKIDYFRSNLKMVFFFSFETKSNRQNGLDGRDFLSWGGKQLFYNKKKVKSNQKHKRWFAEFRPKVNPRNAKLGKARKRAKLANFSLSRGK